MRANVCRYCNLTVPDMTGDRTSDMRAHFLSRAHRERMRPEPKVVVKRHEPDPYVTPDPYTFNEGPMRVLLRAPCIGCHEPVEVTRYTGRIVTVHPGGRLACSSPVRQHQ